MIATAIYCIQPKQEELLRIERERDLFFHMTRVITHRQTQSRHAKTYWFFSRNYTKWMHNGI